MDRLVEGVVRFREGPFREQRALYKRLAWEGEKPVALVISCSDSRVMPEVFTQCEPGSMFVTRNAGNIVPPYGAEPGGAVTSAIEYAVVGLGVRHIVVCGHTDCGAMKALLHPEAVEAMPSVAAWLGHCGCAREAFRHRRKACGSDREAARELAIENIAAQLQNLRTHPCVAAGLRNGGVTLHGWLFDIEAGLVSAMDGATGAFTPIEAADAPPIAQGTRVAPRRLAAAE